MAPSHAALVALLGALASADFTKWTTQVEHSPWKARSIPAGDIYDGTFYIMGGRSGPARFESDIWKSADGLTWELIKEEAEFGARGYMDAVFLKNGTMVLIGGQDLYDCFSDVWVSHDFAQTWTKILDDAPWGFSADGVKQGRSAYKTLVLEDDTIMIFSGDFGAFKDRGFYADVWVTKDAGYTWEKRFDAADLPEGQVSWQSRAGMQVVLLDDGFIYFMGGDNDQYSTFTFTRLGDMWRSGDMGASWEPLGLAPWGNRTGHQCISTDGVCMHCIGGGSVPECNDFKNLLMSDTWRSCDGAQTWTRLSNAGFDCDGLVECFNCGANDMLTREKDGKIWMVGADREKEAPFPMSNAVWTLEDDGTGAEVAV